MKYPTEWRIASAIYFTVAGSILISGMSLTAPSVWHVVAAWLFLLSATVWGWRPVVAARLSIVPVLFLAGLFKYCTSAGDTLFLGGVLGIAAFFIIKTFRSYPAPKSASQ